MPLDTIVVFDPAPGPDLALTLTTLDSTTTWTLGDNSTAIPLDLSAASEGDQLIILFADTLSSTYVGATLEGTSLPAASVSAGDSEISGYCFIMTCPAAAAGNATADFIIDGGVEVGRYNVSVLKASAAVTLTDSAAEAGNISFISTTLDANVAAGGFVVGVAASQDSSGSFTWSGLSQYASALGAATRPVSFASASGLSAATPRSMSITPSSTPSENGCWFTATFEAA